IPTTESSSPTATSAVNEKRRPPLTTLATRLISMTRSCRSSPLGLTVSTAMGWKKVADACARLELQASLSSALGQSLDAAVVAVSAAVEHAGLDAGVGSPLGEGLAGLLGLLHPRQRLEVRLDPVDGRDGLARVVVDELCRDAPVRAEDGQARALRGAADLGPYAAAAAQALLGLRRDGHLRLSSRFASLHAHALFPTLRVTCSPW